MPEAILEQMLAEARVSPLTGKLNVTVLTPGWGSSGYYSPQVVEAAAGVVKAGTLMYLDHIGEAERYDRPGRSVKDIAAKLTSDAKWDGKALVAEADLIPGPYKEAMIALGGSIGVSINGSATDITKGTAEGRTGKIIEGLAEVQSVDFVTRAGRGGGYTALESLLESAITEEEILHLTEATADDRMGHLRDAVRATHGTDRASAWVRDQDAEKNTVWFDVHDHTTSGPSKTYEQTYTVGKNDVEVSLTGDPKQVRAVTQYVPVNPAGPTPTKESKEDTVANIQIEESEHSRLLAEAGRVPTLTTERDAATKRAEAAEQKLAESGARTEALTAATARVKAGNSELPPGTVARIVESATRTLTFDANGKLDAVALNTAVDEARKNEETYLASLAESTGGKLVGFGESATTEDKVTEGAPTHTAWGRPLTEQKGA